MFSARASIINANDKPEGVWQRWWPTILAGFILSLGILCSLWVGRNSEQSLRESLLKRTIAASSLIDQASIRTLSLPQSDVSSSEYSKVSSYLDTVLSTHRDVQNLYLFTMRHGNVVFIIDKSSDGEKAATPPGTIYFDASTHLRESFLTGKPIIEGLSADHPSAWVSGIAPIVDKTDGRVIAVLEMDIPAREWLHVVWEYRLIPLVIAGFLTLLLLLIVGGTRLLCRWRARVAITEDRLNRLFMDVHEGLFNYEFGRGFTIVNPAGLQLLGYTLDELNRAERRSRLIIGVERAAFWEHLVAEARGHTSPSEHELELRAKDGRHLWAHVSLRVVFVGERPVRIEGMLFDITTRKRVEEQMTKLNECFLGFGPDPLRNIDRLTILAGQLMQAESARYNRLEGDHVETVSAWPSKADHINPGNMYGCLCVDLIRQNAKQTSVVRDLSTSSYAATDPNVQCHRLKTCIGQPVFYDDHTIGSLCMVYRNDYEPSQDDIKMLSVLATAIGIEEERLRVESHLEISKQKFRSVAENIRDVIFQADHEGRWDYLNPAWAEITGFTIEESVGQSLFDFVHQDDRESTERLYTSLMQRRQDHYRHVVRFLTKTREIRWVEVHARITFNAVGLVSGIAGTLRDITERHHTEVALQSRDRILHGVASALNTLIEEPDGARAFKRALFELGEATGADRVGIIEAPHDVEMKTPLIHHEWDREGAPKLTIMDDVQQDAFRKMSMRWHEILTAGSPIVGVLDDFPPEERVLLSSRGMRSLLIVPIHIDGAFWGTLGFDSSHHARVWTDAEISILMAAASSIGVAIQRFRSIQALRESEKFTRAVFDTVQVGIAVINAESHTISDANQALADMIGMSVEEMRGRACEKFICPAESTQCLMAQQCQSLSNTEQVLRTCQGNPLPVIKSAVWATLSGEAHLIESFVDISVKQQLENDLRLAIATAEAASRAKSDFLANMSHELRTPLNGVIGMSDLLQTTNLDERQRRYAQTIVSSAESLLGVISEILDFSKIESGHIELEMDAFQLREIVESLGDTFAYQASAKGVELVIHLSPELPQRVIGDSMRIRQVLTNLIGNAIKFTDAGEIVVHCTIEADTTAAPRIRCSVRDTGIGIAEDRLQYLFKPFVQADSSTTRKYGGTGLGLAISKRLIELMGGELTVESSLGGGSQFSFSLPLVLGTTTMSQHMSEEDVLCGVRVLVVDDNSVNCQVLDEQLRYWQMHVDTVNDPQQALDAMYTARAAGQPFQLVLLDQRMPVMDGITLARRIRTHSEFDTTPLVILSSVERILAKSELNALSIAAYVVKPLRQHALYDTLLNVLVAKDGSLELEETAATANVCCQPGGTVLLVEDNGVNQMVVEEMLANLGYTTMIANNGQEAIDIIARESFDLVLMDCQMPVMDGYDATRHIRAQEQLSGGHLPIIALTANATQDDEELCLAAGMDAYLCKPINMVQLREVTERWTGLLNAIPYLSSPK